MMILRTTVVLTAMFMAASAVAQSCEPMSTAQLTQLTANGITLGLGGEGQGYSGSLKLRKDGTGKGSATTDAGDRISIAGTWYIADDRFCRTWSDLNDGQEMCETWCLTSGNTVDVYDGKRKVGVNSW